MNEFLHNQNWLEFNMPKKKTHHREKTSEEDLKPESNDDEEYTTVVDYENKKYSKRVIESNWAKYENLEIETSEEAPKTEDFELLLQTASSDSSHFQFSSEKKWEEEMLKVPSSSLFNLDLNRLSSGLACIPFHERLGLDDSEVTLEDKLEFEKAAAKSREIYNGLIKTATEDDLESKIIECLKEKLNVNEEEEVKAEPEKEEAEPGSKVKIGKLIFGENEGNLEDWLDSVLDD